MTLGLLEAAVYALESYLKDNMATKLAALDTEYNDLTLDKVKKWYAGTFPGALPKYPCCCIVGESWNPEEQRGVNITVANIITVVIFVADSNEQMRFKRLCRYARAVVELLQEGESTYGYKHFLEGEITLSEAFVGAVVNIQAVGVPISLHKLEAY